MEKKSAEKKVYEAPTAEKVEFQYKEQVVASVQCTELWIKEGQGSCTEDNEHFETVN